MKDFESKRASIVAMKLKRKINIANFIIVFLFIKPIITLFISFCLISLIYLTCEEPTSCLALFIVECNKGYKGLVFQFLGGIPHKYYKVEYDNAIFIQVSFSYFYCLFISIYTCENYCFYFYFVADFCCRIMENLIHIYHKSLVEDYLINIIKSRMTYIIRSDKIINLEHRNNYVIWNCCVLWRALFTK